MARKKQGSRGKKQDEFLHARNLMRGTRTPFRSFSEIRPSIHRADYAPFIKWIRTTPLKKVFHPEYPSSLSDLKATPAPTATNLKNEFYWAGAYLSAHLENISTFIQFSNVFQEAFLLNDFTLCEETLQLIQERFGVSLWLLRHTIPFLQYAKGLEQQKQFTQQMKAELPADGIAAYIAHYISMRSEPTLSIARFLSQFTHHLTRLSVDTDLATYVRFHIAPDLSMDDNEVFSVLKYECASTIVDIYDSLIRLSQIVINIGRDDLYPVLRTVLGSLSPIEDTRLSILLFMLGLKCPEISCFDMRFAESLQLFLCGDYARAANLAITSLVEWPCNTELRKLAATATAISGNSTGGKESFLFKILNWMTAIINKSPTMENDTNELLRIAYTFNSYSWGASLFEFVKQETSPDPTQSIGLSHFAATSITSLEGPIIDAPQSSTFHSDYPATMQSFYALCPSILYNQKPPDAQDSICAQNLSWESEALIQAERALASSDLPCALAEGRRLLDSCHDYFKQKSIKIVSHCMLNMGHKKECLEFITSILLKEPRFDRIVPLSQAIDTIDTASRMELKNIIAVPILYDFYSKLVSSSHDAVRNYAYEDFLLAHGLTRPSQISPILHLFDTTMIIYFLKYICIESVMDTSIVFSGSRDISEERISVCRLLVDLDPQHKEDYQTEIKDILRRLMIQRRMRLIEQSKIYVDTESIRKALVKSMAENFNRLASLMELDSSLYDEIRQLIRSSVQKEGIEAIIALVIPKNEVLDLFESMVVQIRDEFVSSTEHGLDGYLSVRIRHGTLSGHLRSPLDVAKLITQKDHTTGEYKSNDYWTNRLNIQNTDIGEKLDQRLSMFSKSFDTLINIINTEWIQVITEKTGTKKGLFDFKLYEYHLTLLYKEIPPGITFDGFIDHIFMFLNEMLLLNLRRIRERVDSEAKTVVNEMLTSLQADIESILRFSNSSVLSNAIRGARTDIQVALDRVAEWFKVAKVTADEPFTLDEAIDISRQSITRTYSTPFEVYVTTSPNMPSVLIHGRFITSFVDILFIVFENIIRHSGLENRIAHVVLANKDPYISVRIENNVAADVNNSTNIDRITLIKHSMKEGGYKRSVSKEGGTGFYKIRKILGHDFKEDRAIDFGFNDLGRFYIEFEIPTKDVEAES